MADASSHQLTELLARAQDGDKAAASEVFACVNSELRQRAKGLFKGERAGHTLQPTAVVNEVCIKLLGSDGRLSLPDIDNRAHFYAIAARIMRQILVDYAREHNTVKRGGDRVKMPFDERDDSKNSRPRDVLRIHEALEALNEIRPRAARVVELKYFGGCTIGETAAAIGVASETVKLDWRFAKAWLKRELTDDG